MHEVSRLIFYFIGLCSGGGCDSFSNPLIILFSVCPREFIFFKGSCHTIVTTGTLWHESSAVCTARNATLGSIHSQDEQDFLNGNLIGMFTFRKMIQKYILQVWLNASSGLDLSRPPTWVNGCGLTRPSWTTRTGVGVRAVWPAPKLPTQRVAYGKITALKACLTMSTARSLMWVNELKPAPSAGIEGISILRVKNKDKHTEYLLFVWFSLQVVWVEWVEVPDEPFHNFRAPESGDRRFLCSLGTSCDGF